MFGFQNYLFLLLLITFSSNILGFTEGNHGFKTLHESLEANFTLDKRIVGGRFVSIAKYPWLVQILNTRTKIVLCGGVLIAANLVLTSGICLKYHRIVTFNALVGKTWSSPDHSEGKSQIRTIKPHSYHRGYDITIGILDTPVQYNSRVQPFQPHQVISPDDTDIDCFVAGWGSIESSSLKNAEKLKEIAVQIYPSQRCGFRWDSQFFFCGGNPKKPAQSLCYYDRGSPLFCRRYLSGKTIISLLGVVTGGDGDCGMLVQRPMFFSNIYKAAWWISLVISTFGVEVSAD